MALKLSVFTTATNAISRGDLYTQSLDCYTELADEVIVVDGSVVTDSNSQDFVKGYGESENIYKKLYEWPKEFDWPLIGQQFQRGYEACTGDWVIRADLDMIFHERDFRAIRMAMENEPEALGLSFWKFQFVLPDRYVIKSRIIVAVNKRKFGNRIRFDSGGDLCQPSFDGYYIEPALVPEAQIPIYNYEKIIKTREQIADDQGRMERAYFRHFGQTQMGSNGTDEDAYKVWVEAQKGKLDRKHKFIKLTDHPKYMQDTIKNLTPDQFGYNGHGFLKENKYVEKT